MLIDFCIKLIKSYGKDRQAGGLLICDKDPVTLDTNNVKRAGSH